MIARFIVILFIGVTVLLPLSVDAQSLASFAGCTGTDCSFCNVVSMTNELIQWLIGFLFLLFAVLIALAGFGLVTSGGDHHALDSAKEKFSNAIIGLIIILAAWLIVDTIMRSLVGGEGNEGEIAQGFDSEGNVTGWLFWSEVQCQVQTVTELEEYEPVFIDTDNLLTPTAITQIPTVNPGGTYTASPGGSAPDGSLTYQPGIEAQRAHASPELEMLLRCIASQVPGGVGQISSISDSAIVAAGGSDAAWQSCWAGNCQHTAGSCHYGNGYGIVGQSYAVDFGDETNADDLIGASYACGAGFAGVHNGNHVHVSVEACRGN